MNDDIDRGSISSLAEWSRVAKLQFAREDRGLREYSILKPQSAGVWRMFFRAVGGRKLLLIELL